MLNFKLFLSEANQSKDLDIKKTIEKLPETFQKLLKDYKFELQSGNSLKNDKEHIGYNDLNNKKIGIAAPWFYSKEFVLLHEISHYIWKHYMTTELKKKWSVVVKKNNNKLKQNDEENFCHAFAATYSKHPPTTHYNKEWSNFIKNLT